MRFSQLLESAGLAARRRGGDPEVTHVVADSRRVGVGSCYVAIRGTAVDGHGYIPAAVEADAAAIVCEDDSAAGAAGAVAVVADTREAVGRLAQAIRGWPGREMVNIGVTGTNGKTTVTYLIAAILESAGFAPAVMGTIQYQTGRRAVPASTTTPDPIEMADLAAEMLSSGRTHLVMEASSHALDQRRTSGLEFQVAVFTNLTGDHMDYHKTVEHYLASKRRLFEGLSGESVAVVNRDDPAGEKMVRDTAAVVRWYGLSAASDLRGRVDRIDPGGTAFALIEGDREVPVATPLIGRHNVMNCLAAAAACRAVGIELDRIAAALATVHRIPGRLERVPGDAPYEVFVDYAHTDDALRNVLESLLPIRRNGRVTVVFGCGGDRDRSKRPRMARVAADLADRIVVTSDNPRTERPAAIIDEIIAGLDEAGRRKTDIEPDRRRAIGMAIDQAGPGDVVLIAGKGHEAYQIIGDQRIEFDDVTVAAEAIRRREAPG